LTVTGIVVTNAASEQAIPALGKFSDSGNRPGQEGSYAPLVEKTIASVASVYTTRVVRASAPPGLPFGFGFPDLFGRGPGQEQLPDQFEGPAGPDFGEGRSFRQSGLGSGVIVSSTGYLLTNHHVVDGASEIKVRLHDNRTFDAKIIGSDRRSDIAVLDIEADGLQPIPFGNSSNVHVGDIVLAIGNPFGVGETVTFGIVGAKGRGGINPESYEDFIQTDAAINPGNSGGALVNTAGNLIGINTAIISRSGGNQGIGFAVPVNMTHFVMKELITHGKVSRGYIGVTIQDLTDSLAQAFKVPDNQGALVTSVEPGSPADKAGVKRGDVIRKVDGQTVTDTPSLRARIGSLSPNTKLQLSLLRNGQPVEVTLTLALLPDDGQTDSPAAPRRSEPSTLQGVDVRNVTPQILSQLGLPADTRGVVVTGVVSGSPAFNGGLRRGDVIREVNRTPVSNLNEYRQALQQSSGTVLLLVNRQGGTLFLAIEPGSPGR
jgi:serine protease Do